MRKSDLVLLGAAVLGGALFLAARSRLWPETGLELVVPPATLEARARTFADAAGLPPGPWTTASRLDLDTPALTWLESTRGRDEARRLLRDGLPLYEHVVQFKRAGEPSTTTIRMLPGGVLSGWERTLEDDDTGAVLDSAGAWERCRSWILLQLSEDVGSWSLRRHARRDLDARSDHEFVFERVHPGAPGVRERLEVRVAGGAVTRAQRLVVPPPSVLRERRARAAPEDFVRTLALTCFATLGCAAFLLKLRSLRERRVGLRVPAIGAGLVLLCLGISRVLRPARILELWDPLGERWMAVVRILMTGLVNDLLPAVMVFAFLGASDALDRKAPRHRGIALRNFLRLRWDHVDVGHASLRGFLLGLVAGGVLSAVTWVLSFLPGARIDLQPRGFFFHGINSALPTVVLGAYFFQIALVEELGWRHFAGNLLLRLRVGRWAAALVPALFFGMVHAGLDFLPPAEPWWARLLPIAVVGGVWGLAFVRWDALTVLLSHWACDLFLFNQPRLSSDDPATWLSALGCIGLPLLPAAVNLGIRAFRHWKRRPDEDWADESDFDGADPAFDPESAFDAEPEVPAEEAGEDPGEDVPRDGR